MRGWLQIWVGCKWLCTYINLRPTELLNVKVKHINRRSGTIFIPHPKEKKSKMIFLDSEDKELLNRFSEGLPDLYFFRHVAGISGVKAGQKFGDKYFYKWWKKACDTLGIKNLCLYGGARHTSATALSEFCTSEQVKEATVHLSKALERYFMNKQGRAKKVTAKLKELQNSNQPLINLLRTKNQ